MADLGHEAKSPLRLPMLENASAPDESERDENDVSLTPVLDGGFKRPFGTLDRPRGPSQQNCSRWNLPNGDRARSKCRPLPK